MWCGHAVWHAHAWLCMTGCGFLVYKDPASAEAAIFNLHEKRTIPGVGCVPCVLYDVM